MRNLGGMVIVIVNGIRDSTKQTKFFSFDYKL